MTTTLTLHMTPQFLQQVTGSSTGTGGTGTQGGVWAYLFDNSPPDTSPTTDDYWTTLINAGSIAPGVVLGADGNYNITIPLTTTSVPTVNGGVIYLLLQSESPDPSTHHDLIDLIGTDEGNIQPNVQNWNYGYAQFEFSLLNHSADEGDLTAIPGFGPHLAVNVQYSNGTSSSRGYAITGTAMTTALTNAEPNAALKYPTSTTGTPFSPLDGQTSMVISPSNGNFGTQFYPSSNWSSYLDAFASATATAGVVNISGFTNGEPDASGIWHNAQYYSYTVQSKSLATGAWGPSGTYFEFIPNAGSQTQGYILISQATLQDNLYAAGQGYATLWQDEALITPYIIPGSGNPPGTAPTTNQFNPSANNEWGNVFTPLFTGFTAGYWGAQANQSNPMNRAAASASNLGSGTVDLDNTIYQSSSYAFDLNRSNAIPSYQHNDAYSQQFFNESNVYGSAFSDNLSNGLTPGPLIGLSTPGTSTNVSNIDLYLYSTSQIDPYYIDPVGGNYVALPNGQQDYLVPTQTSGLQMIVSGMEAGVLIESTAPLQLGIYKGNGTFTYVPLTNTAGNIWQNYNIAGSAASGWTGASGGSNVAGTFIINNLPTPATAANGGVYWYQLVIGSGANQKVIDFYATSNGTVGQVQTGLSTLAADGQASIQANTSSQLQLAVNPPLSLPSALLDFEWFNNQNQDQPAAPVAGTGIGTGFLALDQQNGTGLNASLDGDVPASSAPSVTYTGSAALQFGWTGTNNGTHTGTPTLPSFVNPPSNNPYNWGLVSEYTNKINAGDIALIQFKNTASGQFLPLQLKATADLDGQWLTSGDGAQLGNGTYQVTMTETLPNGAIFGPASVALTLTVDVATLAIGATSGGAGVQLGTTGGGGPVSGNWLHVDPVQVDHASLPQGADVLLYATNAAGQLLDRDGHTGSGLTIADATLARLGLMKADDGQTLLTFGNAVFLRTDEQLHFAILGKDGSIDSNPSTNITLQTDGSLLVDVAGLQFITRASNALDHTDYLAAAQHDTNLPLLYLDHGATMLVDVAGSAANVNALGFARLDIDSHGAMSVAGVAYGNTAAFHQAVRDNLDSGFSVLDGARTFEGNRVWTVAGDSGYYAPVVVTQYDEVLLIGTANADGKEHIRLMGQNAFGVEDLLASRNSDFDYNDMIIGIASWAAPA